MSRTQKCKGTEALAAVRVKKEIARASRYKYNCQFSISHFADY